jgi:hypothetical protein
VFCCMMAGDGGCVCIYARAVLTRGTGTWGVGGSRADREGIRVFGVFPFIPTSNFSLSLSLFRLSFSSSVSDAAISSGRCGSSALTT